MLMPKRVKYRRPHRLSYEGPSKGGTVMKIKGDNKVVTVADVPHEEEEQAEKTEETDVQPADEAVEAVSEETADE